MLRHCVPQNDIALLPVVGASIGSAKLVTARRKTSLRYRKGSCVFEFQ